MYCLAVQCETDSYFQTIVMKARVEVETCERLFESPGGSGGSSGADSGASTPTLKRMGTWDIKVGS